MTLGQIHQCDGAKQFIRITLPLITGFTVIYIYKRYKICTYSLSLIKNTSYYKNECQQEDGQYNNRVNEYSYVTDY